MMDDNETNAPTITPELLPCPFCGSDAERRDELTKGIEGVVSCTNCGGCNFASEWNTRNEADALRAEVEGLRTAIIGAIRETCDIQQAIRDGKTDNLVVIENSFYVIQDNLEMALAAIKPNAAAGEEGTE